MKRRSNKSHRVPNVKLRPGEPQPSSSLLESNWPEDTQLRSDDTTFKDTCPRPFRNIMLCATGIADKPALFKKALELGAGAISAFTDKVTHLIAVDHGGPKYKCALEHNIPIVRPSWIEENYQIWLHGDDVETDLDKSIEYHRLPVFLDVVVCLSGIPEIERRADIRRIVEQQGGTYVKAIERPVKVTHLLCSGDEETDKMRYAEKFIKRGEAQIHIVWEDWFWDSLKVKGRLDETRYNVRNPRPPPIVLRMTQPNVPDSTSSSRANSMIAPERPSPAPPDANDLDDEAARVKIVPDITLKVWTGLLERRGYEVADGEMIRSPSKSQNKSHSPTPPPDRRRGGKLSKNMGVISAVRSVNTFEPVEKEGATSNGSQRPLPFRRTTSTLNPIPGGQRRASTDPPQMVDANEAGPSNHNQTSASQSEPQPQPPQIFLEVTFCLLGEANTPAVRGAIESSGGTVISEGSNTSGTIDIFLVRLLSGSRIYRSESDANLRAKYRTECWLERCIYEERICGLDEHVSFGPLAISLPVPGANDVLIGLSGLDQSESCHTRRLLKAFGVNLIPLFSRKATHLLCPSGLGLKFDKAQEWGIPIVSNDWLTAIASTGAIPAANEHVVYEKVVDVKGKGRAVDALEKGKGKSKIRDRSASAPADDSMDVDGHMHDITNNHLEHPPPSLKPSAHPAPLGKSGSLDRQPTTIITDGQALARGFGQPTEMLGSLPNSTAASSFYALPSSVSPLIQGTPLVKYGTNPKYNSIAHSLAESLHLEEGREREQPHPASRPNKSRKLTAQSTPSHKSSRASSYYGDDPPNYSFKSDNDEDNDNDMRIPSSKSPSPMKGPRRNASLSPAKLDPGAAKALQESIASLLGKRQSPEDEDDADSLPVVDESAGSGAAVESGESLTRASSKSEGVKARGGKRKRPQRAKPSIRANPKARKSPPAPSHAGAGAGVSLSAFDPYGAGTTGGASIANVAAAAGGSGESQQSQMFEEQSVRVMYEDPAQLEERQRLMNMLQATTSTGEETSVGTTLSGSSVKTGSISTRSRRSTRARG